MNSSHCQKSLDAMWAAIDELRAKRELEEAQRASELWEGISAGDYVQLSEAQHIAKGGLLLTDEHGALLLKQVQAY